MHQFNINNVILTVQVNFSSIRDTLDGIKSNWEEGVYTHLYSCDEGLVKHDEYLADIETMYALVNDLETHPSELEQYVAAIRKKKNGRFWSNSGVTIDNLPSACAYFTDYTNAWRVWQLRLEVVDDTTCELVLRQRTETY